MDVTGGSVVKNPPANTGDMGLIPGLGRSHRGGNGNALFFHILAWKIQWTEEPGGLQSMKSQGPDTTQRLNHHQNVGMNVNQRDESSLIQKFWMEQLRE